MTRNDEMSTASAQPSSAWAFLVDENLPLSLAVELRALGHAVEHVREAGMGGAKDPAVYAYAQTKGLTVITGTKISVIFELTRHRTWVSWS